MLTTKQEKVIEKAVEKGGVTQKMLKTVYSHRSNISEICGKMVAHGYLEESDAPNYDSARKVYFPTDKGKAMIES